MKLNRKPRGEVTRQAILEAAELVFAEVGYAAARLEDVAEAVGIRRPSIVYYFSSKQELYDAVEADIFADLHAFSQARLKQADACFPRLIALLDAWLDFHVGRPSAARIIQRLVADVTPRQGNPVQYSNSALKDIEAVVNEGVAAGQFVDISPIQLLNSVGAGALFYVCNAGQVGENRRYDPADPAELARFRALLHRLAAAAVRGDRR
ncbi:TetR family transcriptional regulator [Altererythrobacter aerius]|uniref:TetR family transcriptional regulator n=1 Tax=Tsuneonella aeria TaxID=1837929 RepID=A0A6I4TC54_9SPHN|nr:TetR/AcrR family transcriptional regulator [Tsuneonella aeria]MXO75119.1 TetR family transcriptional regulator [Tsuneonella aeria]